MVVTNGKKLCKACGLELDVELHFYPNKGAEDGYDAPCKACSSVWIMEDERHLNNWIEEITRVWGEDETYERLMFFEVLYDGLREKAIKENRPIVRWVARHE